MVTDGVPAASPGRHDPAGAFAARAGVVATFDDHEGAGTLVDDETGATWWFHCTRIAGGARTIAVGVPVRFRSEPGPTGLEAVDVSPVATPTA